MWRCKDKSSPLWWLWSHWRVIVGRCWWKAGRGSPQTCLSGIGYSLGTLRRSCRGRENHEKVTTEHFFSPFEILLVLLIPAAVYRLLKGNCRSAIYAFIKTSTFLTLGKGYRYCKCIKGFHWQLQQTSMLPIQLLTWNASPYVKHSFRPLRNTKNNSLSFFFFALFPSVANGSWRSNEYFQTMMFSITRLAAAHLDQDLMLFCHKAPTSR